MSLAGKVGPDILRELGEIGVQRQQREVNFLYLIHPLFIHTFAPDD